MVAERKSKYEYLSDGTEREWDKNGQLTYEHLPEELPNEIEQSLLRDIEVAIGGQSETEVYNQTNNQEAISLQNKLSNILKNARPSKINPDNLLDGSTGFTTPYVIERYSQQDVTHATGRIILNNRLSMKYLLTGEGSNYFGAGLYFEENPAVAEIYRKFGIPNFGKGTLHVHTKDGKIFSASDYNHWDNSPDILMRDVLNLIQETATNDNTLEHLKSILST